MYWYFPNTNVRILGSMHLLPASNVGLPDWAVKAFEWAEVLVFESDPPAILPYLRATEPLNLQHNLTPATWNALTALWPSSGTLPLIENTRMWAVLLCSSVFAQKTAEGVEPQFMRWAAEQSKPVQFLESGEDIATAFDSAPIIEIRDAIELLASDLTVPQRSLEAMYAAWLRKDIQALFEVASQSSILRSPGLKAAVLDRRNRAWMPALRQLMDTQRRTLIAVGALHLYGPGNAIEFCGQNALLVPMSI